jgi:hypothetical protein
MMGGFSFDSNLAVPLTVTLPYSGELPISGTVPISEVISLIGETTILTVTLPYTDKVSITDTLPITSELAILMDTQVVTDDLPLELNQAVLTVTIPVTQSVMMDDGSTMVITETTEVIVTGVLSDNLTGSSVDFFPIAPLPMVDMVKSETGWSHEVTISYTYDLLNRLREAEYSDSRQFEYTYDAVGNIITRTVDISSGNPVITIYQYDPANRLTYVDSQPYTWDDNGNLLGDGSNSYTYDHANRLIGLSGSGMIASYAYNGLGDRLQQSVDSVTTDYTLDLAGGLTQVLSDGDRTYVYGNGRISQYTGTTPE